MPSPSCPWVVHEGLVSVRMGSRTRWGVCEGREGAGGCQVQGFGTNGK